MRTTTGFEVVKPHELIFAFVHDWYWMYDGVEVVQDNKLRIVEIALSTMLNSRISGNTGGEIWQERADVEEALADIRAGVDLLDVPQGDSIPDELAISRAVTAMCRVRRSKLSVATKILHKKRPGLIPIFDRGQKRGTEKGTFCFSVGGGRRLGAGRNRGVRQARRSPTTGRTHEEGDRPDFTLPAAARRVPGSLSYQHRS